MYRVEWSHLAFTHLMDLLTSLAPGDWERVVAAVNLLEVVLAEDPLEQGESRSGDERVTFIDPLGVLFEVSASDRRVTVLAAWWPRSRTR